MKLKHFLLIITASSPLYDDGYRYASNMSHHGGIEQRWLLVYSEHAYVREKETLGKNPGKKETELLKLIRHLGDEVFGCETDAETEVVKSRKQYPLYHIAGQAVPILKYAGKGKPGPGAKQVVKGYQLDLFLERKTEEVEAILNRKGRFILATNGHASKPVGQGSAGPNPAVDFPNHGGDCNGSLS